MTADEARADERKRVARWLKKRAEFLRGDGSQLLMALVAFEVEMLSRELRRAKESP